MNDTGRQQLEGSSLVRIKVVFESAKLWVKKLKYIKDDENSGDFCFEDRYILEKVGKKAVNLENKYL